MTRAPSSDYLFIDTEILRLARQQTALDHEVGQWLLLAAKAGVHRALGMASFVEYVERRLGYSPKMTKERLRVAARLEQLPKLNELLVSGARSWGAVREITRVAVRRTEDEWIAHTEGKTVREIEGLVRGKRAGDRPSDAPDPLLARRRVVFDLSPEEFAILQDAIDRMRGVLGPHATNAEVLRAMGESVLGKGRDLEHQPAYQASITLCADCGRTWRHAAGEAIEVPESIGACARCDGEIAGLTAIDPDPDPDPQPHVGPGAAEQESDPIRAIVQDRGIRGLVQEVSKVLGLEHQTLSPKLRGIVLARDRYRCSVPGCNNHLFLQIHHLKGRAHSGCHSPDETALLCSTHHELHHAGYLAIEGSPSAGLVFRHASGTLYGEPRVTGASDKRTSSVSKLAGFGTWQSNPAARARR
jgi:hypothetical protein